ETGDVAGALAALAPTAPSYRALQAALIVWRDRADREAGGAVPPPVAAGPSLKPGMTGARVAALRQRLAAEGLLATDSGDSGDAANAASGDVHDAATEAAVGSFQRALGLEADGIAGPVTLRALNRSAA